MTDHHGPEPGEDEAHDERMRLSASRNAAGRARPEPDTLIGLVGR